MFEPNNDYPGYLYPWKKRYKYTLHINIVDHCDLKCAGCSNFSCISEYGIVEKEEFEKDLKRIKEILGTSIRCINLLGGEPLLHPYLEELFYIVRKFYPKTHLTIQTNAVSFKQKSESFWKSCKDTNVDIHISKYPIKLDEDFYLKKFEEYGIEWSYLNNSVCEKFTTYPIDLLGKQNSLLNFCTCTESNRRIHLYKGKLSTCQVPLVIRHFNKKFGKNIPVTEEDYVDIYKEGLTRDEIFEKIRKPTNICKYCSPTKSRDFPWRISNQTIDEYI